MKKGKTGRNDPCFCGSGKKYKHCCLELVERMKGDDSYLFFPDEPDREKVGRYIEQMTATRLERGGTSPEYIYAYRKTGHMLTENNRRFFSQEDLEEWQEAIDEYRRQHGLIEEEPGEPGV